MAAAQLSNKLISTAGKAGVSDHMVDDIVTRVVKSSTAGKCTDASIDATIRAVVGKMVSSAELNKSLPAIRATVKGRACAQGLTTTKPATAATTAPAQADRRLFASKVVPHPKKANVLVVDFVDDSGVSFGSLEVPKDAMAVVGRQALVRHIVSQRKVTKFLGWENVTRAPATTKAAAKPQTTTGAPVSTTPLASFKDEIEAAEKGQLATNPGAQGVEDYTSPPPRTEVLPEDGYEQEYDDGYSPNPSMPVNPSNAPRDPVTGMPLATTPSGVKLDLTVENENDNQGGNRLGGLGGLPSFGLPVAVPPSYVASPQPGQQPLDQGVVATVAPQPAVSADPQMGGGGGGGGAASAVTAEEPKSGNFFCMTKSRFILVVVLLIVASLLAGVGYYIWSKKGSAAGNNAGASAPGGGMNNLGGLGLGGPSGLNP